MELPIYDDFVKRVDELAKDEKQPTFEKYPMFEWAPEIPIMDDMTENKEEESNGEDYEIELIEYIVE